MSTIEVPKATLSEWETELGIVYDALAPVLTDALLQALYSVGEGIETALAAAGDGDAVQVEHNSLSRWGLMLTTLAADLSGVVTNSHIGRILNVVRGLTHLPPSDS